MSGSKPQRETEERFWGGEGVAGEGRGRVGRMLALLQEAPGSWQGVTIDPRGLQEAYVHTHG